MDGSTSRTDGCSPESVGESVVEGGGMPVSPFRKDGRLELSEGSFGENMGDASPSEYLRAVEDTGEEGGRAPKETEVGEVGSSVEDDVLLPCTSRSKNSIQSAEKVCSKIMIRAILNAVQTPTSAYLVFP
jgi:hypothetical protein